MYLNHILSFEETLKDIKHKFELFVCFYMYFTIQNMFNLFSNGTHGNVLSVVTNISLNLEGLFRVHL